MLECRQLDASLLAPVGRAAASPLLAFAFAAMGSAGLYEAAADMLVEAVHFSSDAREHQALIAAILPQTLRLVPAYDAATQAGDEPRTGAVSALHGDRRAVPQDHPTEPRAVGAAGGGAVAERRPRARHRGDHLQLWYILAEELAGAGAPSTTRMHRGPPPVRTRLPSCSTRCTRSRSSRRRAPRGAPTSTTSTSAYAVGDAITDVRAQPHRLPRAHLAQLQGVLLARRRRAGGGPRRAECCVWCMRQMVSNGDPTFFGGGGPCLLPALPAAGERRRPIRTIGTYASWLNRTTAASSPAHVSRGLADQKTAAAASQALKHMCEARGSTSRRTRRWPTRQHVPRRPAPPLHPADRADLAPPPRSPSARWSRRASPPPPPSRPSTTPRLAHSALARGPRPIPLPPPVPWCSRRWYVAQPRVLRLRACRRRQWARRRSPTCSRSSARSSAG